MKIGIPKETKKNEKRIALTPWGVDFLVRSGHQVSVEENAGVLAGFSNEEYEAVGANIETVTDRIYDNSMVVRVKQPPKDDNENYDPTLRNGQILVCYPHIDKHQDLPLEKALLRNKVATWAYEEFRFNGDRTVNLGFEAGLVGAYEALRLWGQKNPNVRGAKALARLLDMRDQENKDAAYQNLAELAEQPDLKIYITGKGLTSRGAQETLRAANLPFQILYRPETAQMSKAGKYLDSADILLNCVVWNPGDTRLVTKENIGLMRHNTVISDITCDNNGSIEMCKEGTWDDSFYEVGNKIWLQTIGNLPAALGNDASKHLEQMSIPYIMLIANGGKPNSGLMTEKGRYVFKKE